MQQFYKSVKLKLFKPFTFGIGIGIENGNGVWVIKRKLVLPRNSKKGKLNHSSLYATGALFIVLLVGISIGIPNA